MLKCICIDVRRAFLSRKFMIAVMLCCMIYLLGSISEKGATDILYILDVSINTSAFYHLLPIVAVLPFSCSYLEDRKSGYIKFILQRVTPKQYLVARFFVVALSGAFATILGMLLFLAVLPVFHPWAVLRYEEGYIAIYSYMEDIVQHKSWILYFTFYAYLQGLSGMFWGSIALSISVFVQQPQILYLTAVLLMEIISRLLFSLQLEHLIVLATGAIQTSSKSHVLMQSSLVYMGFIVLCFSIYYMAGKRRLQHV